MPTFKFKRWSKCSIFGDLPESKIGSWCYSTLFNILNNRDEILSALLWDGRPPTLAVKKVNIWNVCSSSGCAVKNWMLCQVKDQWSRQKPAISWHKHLEHSVFKTRLNCLTASKQRLFYTAVHCLMMGQWGSKHVAVYVY